MKWLMGPLPLSNLHRQFYLQMFLGVLGMLAYVEQEQKCTAAPVTH